MHPRRNGHRTEVHVGREDPRRPAVDGGLPPRVEAVVEHQVAGPPGVDPDVDAVRAIEDHGRRARRSRWDGRTRARPGWPVRPRLQRRGRDHREERFVRGPGRRPRVRHPRPRQRAPVALDRPLRREDEPSGEQVRQLVGPRVRRTDDPRAGLATAEAGEQLLEALGHGMVVLARVEDVVPVRQVRVERPADADDPVAADRGACLAQGRRSGRIGDRRGDLGVVVVVERDEVERRRAGARSRRRPSGRAGRRAAAPGRPRCRRRR